MSSADASNEITLSIENEWGSKHNFSTKIEYQEYLAFIPSTFHSTNFVAFKPLYITADIIISCDYDIINLDLDNWKNDTNIFSSKWNIKSLQSINENIFESSDRNLFINPLSLQQPITSQDLIVEYKVTIENLDILSSNNAFTITPIIEFPLQRILGNIKAIISNGVYQYFPTDTTWISLVGNEYSFDQEPDTDSSDWNYIWSCIEYDTSINSELCQTQIQNQNNQSILEFNTNVMERDVIYMFNLQIIDPNNERMDQTFMFLSITPSVHNIVSLNIDWDKDAYYLPTHYTDINIIQTSRTQMMI